MPAQNIPQRCYLCGTAENLTGDHVPPKGLFPSPRPSNLLTVPCCYPCNNGMAQDDEYFRIAVSSMLGRSERGDQIWHERVVPSTLRKRRIGPLIDEIAAEACATIVRTPFGEFPATAIPLRCDEINRVLVRITKAFLFLTHPEVDSAPLDYYVTMIQQFRFTEMAPFLNRSYPYFEIGDGVFRMWRGLDIDLRRGIWFYLFYDSAGFGVEHEPNQHIPKA